MPSNGLAVALGMRAPGTPVYGAIRIINGRAADALYTDGSKLKEVLVLSRLVWNMLTRSQDLGQPFGDMPVVLEVGLKDL